MISFTSDIFPNCHINFDSKGTVLSASLNISPAMKKYLSPNNVFKGKIHWVYVLKKRVDNPTQVTMKKAYDDLMDKLMTNHRIAQQAVLGEQIIKINEK